MLCIFLQRLTQPYFLEKQVLIFLRLKHKIKSKLIRMIKTFHNAFKIFNGRLEWYEWYLSMCTLSLFLGKCTSVRLYVPLSANPKFHC